MNRAKSVGNRLQPFFLHSLAVLATFIFLSFLWSREVIAGCGVIDDVGGLTCSNPNYQCQPSGNQAQELWTCPDNSIHLITWQCDTAREAKAICGGGGGGCTGACGGTAYGWVDTPNISPDDCPKGDSAWRVRDGTCQH